jgi:dolichol-phosphate mannosyltransferase
MDSDGQFTADDLPRFLAALESGSNLVFGWRKVRHDPLSRKVMSLVFRVLARHYIGSTLHDLNVGLRMFDRRFMACAEIQHRLNLANPELYVCARRAGLKVSEVYVTHSARLAGQSCHDVKKLYTLFQMVHQYFRSLSQRLKAPVEPCQARRSAA